MNLALNHPCFVRPKNLPEETATWTDPIVEETRRLREEYAAKHGHNVHAIIEDLKQWEKDGFPLPHTENESVLLEIILDDQRKVN